MQKQVQAGYAQSILRRELEGLPPRERMVVLLRVQQRKRYDEISSLTGLPEGDVGCLVRHGLSELARRLRAAGLI